VGHLLSIGSADWMPANHRLGVGWSPDHLERRDRRYRFRQGRPHTAQWTTSC